MPGTIIIVIILIIVIGFVYAAACVIKKATKFIDMDFVAFFY